MSLIRSYAQPMAANFAKGLSPSDSGGALTEEDLIFARISDATTAQKALISTFITTPEWLKVKACFLFGLPAGPNGALRDLKSNIVAVRTGTTPPVHQPSFGYHWASVTGSIETGINPSVLGLANNEHWTISFYTSLIDAGGSRQILLANDGTTQSRFAHVSDSYLKVQSVGTSMGITARLPAAGETWLVQRDGNLYANSSAWINSVDQVKNHAGGGAAANDQFYLGENPSGVTEIGLDISMFTVGEAFTDPATFMTAQKTLLDGLQAI